jgi:hypothetical protein
MTYHDGSLLTTVPDAAKPRVETGDLLRATLFAAVILATNLYICWPQFRSSAAYVNSMHGFWIALADRADGSWLHPTWWPYWAGGMPFEFTYAPLVPALLKFWSTARGLAPIVAFHQISAMVYCLVPLTLFWSAWWISRMPGYSFAAAMIYTLTAPTQWLAPDPNATWKSIWDARRLFLSAVWDETPHLIALACLPLTIVFLWQAFESGKPRLYAAAALSISVASLASAFGVTTSAIAAICVLFASGEKTFVRNLGRVFAIGILAYAICAVFLPPSLLWAMRSSQPEHDEPGFTAGSLTALAIVAFGWALVWTFLRRWTPGWRGRLLALSGYLLCSIPLTAFYFHRQFFPQPLRYRIEMELAFAVVLAFTARLWMKRWPAFVQRTFVFLLMSFSLEQMLSEHAYSRNLIFWHGPEKTVESRVSTWIGQSLPGVRVMLPGSIAQWADAFAPIQQVGGNSWSMPFNKGQELALASIYKGANDKEEDARNSLAWARAFGAGAIAVSNAESEEFWKPFAHPDKFDGKLPVLLSDHGVTIYRIPQRTAGLAHVVPKSAVIERMPSGPGDIASLERYDAALDNPALPAADFQWIGRNQIRIHTTTAPGQAVSIQVSEHPGWHAAINGRSATIHRDGLGLMWLDPGSAGPCEIELNYDGGFELRACRDLSAIAIFIAALLLFLPSRVLQRQQPR